MIKWRTVAENALRDLESLRASIPDMQDQLLAYNSKITGIRSATSDGTPVSGGGSGREDMLLNTITERDLLEDDLRATSVYVEKIDRALSFLSPQDREILDLCYIHWKHGNLDLLCDRMQCELTTVYNRRNRAVRAFAKRWRGVAGITI